MGAYRGFGRLNLQKNVRKALIAGSTFQVSVAIHWEIQTCATQPFLCDVFTVTHTSSTPHILSLPKL